PAAAGGAGGMRRGGSSGRTASPSPDLASLTVPQLRARARDEGRTGYSRMTKAQLVDLLS
ncbi:MAG: Rho termination factor, partial [Microbacterium sp.]|nr:Rho termination factor [Microbacterium sp.]